MQRLSIARAFAHSWDIGFLQHELAPWIGEQEGSLKIIANSRNLGYGGQSSRG